MIIYRLLMLLFLPATLSLVRADSGVAAPGDQSPPPPPLPIDYEDLLSTQVSILETLDKIDDDIERRSVELNQLQDERQKLTVNLVALEVHAEETTNLIQKTRLTIRTRLYSIILARRSAPIDLILNPERYIDDVRKDRTLRLMLAGDKRRIDAYRKQLATYKLEQANLETKRDELVNIEASVLEKKKKLDADRATRLEIMRRIHDERRFFEKAHKDLLAAYDKLAAKIAKMEAWQDKKLHFGDMRGQFRLPMSYAHIVTPYGPQKNDRLGTTTHHPGVELKSTGSVKVRSVYWGRVVFAGWLLGYGNTVILDHTGGYYTIYGHLAQIDVSLNEVVETRQVLGTIGGPAALGTPGTLYFEIRENGHATDPTKWFAPAALAGPLKE